MRLVAAATLLCPLAAVLVLDAPARAEEAAAPAAAGVVTGKVTVEGAADGPIVVYIEETPDEAKAAKERPKVVQKNTRFEPGVVIVVKGQKVDFPNEDLFYHNVFSVSPGNEFDLGLYRGGVSKSAKLKKPGEVDVYCNIHENMHAKILVLQNDHYVAASDDGSFKLEGVPPGKYTLVAWSKSHAPGKAEIEVKASGTTTQGFSLKAKPKSKHLNKHGEQYGRYK